MEGKLPRLQYRSRAERRRGPAKGQQDFETFPNQPKMKLEKLTSEQESQMVAFREEWRKTALSTERIDKEKTKEAISAMYKLIGKEPPVFIFCPSLLFAQFQINYCREVFPLIFKDKANLG